MVRPEDVDIRLAVGVPVGDQPIKLECPMHKERIGVPDDKASLAIYRSNVHCFGCFFHISRRYAALAFLLGEWDGRGREDSERVRDAVNRIKPRLHTYTSSQPAEPKGVPAWEPPAINPVDVEVFHQYLLTYARKRMLDELQRKRGLSLATIKKFRLGHTGTHFTIPVPDLAGGYQSIRYRADEAVMDTDDTGFRKYEGTWRRNLPYLYPLSVVAGLHRVEELWLTEGEYDAAISNQKGAVTLTVTNGAGSVARAVSLVTEQLPSLRVGRWVIATDQDAVGDVAAKKIMEKLGGEAVRARWPWGNDLSEFYGGGGSRKMITYSGG